MRGSSILGIVTLVLALGACLAVFFDSRRERPGERESRVFEALVGGLGMGPALDLSQCDFSFDPRVGSCCPNDLGPIPGGMQFCHHHASSVLVNRQPAAETALVP